MISTDSNYNTSLLCQACILIIIIIMYILYKFNVFKDPDYNKLSYFFSIVLFLWLLSISGRYILKQTNNDVSPKIEDKIIIFNPPESIKCFFGERYCQEGYINMWTIFHFFIYFFAGLYVPHKYGVILFISIMCEIIENILGFPSKFIIDPVVNLTGYFIGSQLSSSETKKD
jgi:hypothetical protein